MEIDKATARKLMIEKQGFPLRPKKATKDDIYDMIDRLGCIQIDTINVVERAHHLTLWSRLGNYDKTLLHQLAYDDRRIFEYWAHAACYIPLKDYRYFLHPMETRHKSMVETFSRRNKGDPALMDQVLERVKAEGPLSAKDFEHKRKRPSKGWWDWKPAKVALETLFGAGILLISHRENFQRHYDLAERVLPARVDTTMPTEKERARFYAAHTMDSLGLVKGTDLRQYYLPWSILLRKTSRQWEKILDEMVEQGEAARYDVEGEKDPYFCLARDVDRVQELAEGAPSHEGVTLLNNFDNLIWDRPRIQALFDFEVKMEAYVPADKRKYGYYNLPILSGSSLVGRIVPKMDRKTGTLIIHSTWHEPRFKPDKEYEDAYAQTLQEFADFNGAERIEMREERPRIG